MKLVPIDSDGFRLIEVFDLLKLLLLSAR